jgi:hypothetical protein
MGGLKASSCLTVSNYENHEVFFGTSPSRVAAAFQSFLTDGLVASYLLEGNANDAAEAIKQHGIQWRYLRPSFWISPRIFRVTPSISHSNPGSAS